jgi:hypothetical protein
MILTDGCTNPRGEPGFFQAGFIQLPGDAYDKVFTETSTCTDLYPPIEFPSKPRTTSRFNLYNRTSGLAEAYQGSSLLQTQTIDWASDAVQVFAETHDTDDQAYGGTSAKQKFDTPQYEDRSGGFHNDALALTPNDRNSNNDAGVSWWSWMKLTVGTNAFYTYDSACTS